VKKKSPLRAVVTVLLIAAACLLLVRHFHIKNFNAASPGVLYTSGQPRGMDYTRLLYKYHIATIVNLRSPAEHRERNWHNEEITWVRSNGVKYFEMPLDRNISVPGHFPDAKMQEQFLAIMADKANLPVLVHDSSGESRAAMLAAVWLIKGERLPVLQAIDAVSRIKSAPLAEPEMQFIKVLAGKTD
jgi:protein tyrosine/serine phosphatase